MRLADLVRAVLNDTDIRRIRLSSVEPMDWTDDLLRLVAESPRIAKHVHAPLQSGSDTVLRRMHRKYRPRHYEDRLRLARQLMPDAAIGADVMTGFPGETEAEFKQTLDFVEALPLTYLHIFPYSERPGTPAADWGDQVPWPVRKERGRILKQAAQRKNLEFRRRMIGRTLPAVTLHDDAALTSNYLNVEMTHSRPAKQLVDLTIGGISESGLTEHAAFAVLA
jgi:threonylcarbamoyladenosine tRNA methylthiotransferase MtaB